jgi:carboxylesterase
MGMAVAAMPFFSVYNKHMSQIMHTAEPFFIPGKSPVGVLLTHGFTGTPKEMRWMGEYLNREHGYNVLGIRLTGHATHPEDMIRSRYIDWQASVEDGFHLLSGAANNIYLCGLSMGGILSLYSASRLPVKGVVAMSTPYKLPDDPRLKFIRLYSMVYQYMPKDEEDGTGWFGDTWKNYHVSYRQSPVRSIGELNLMLGEMRAALPEIKVPVLLIHSRNDDYVVKDSMERIYADLGTQDKTKLWVEGAGHIMTEEPIREQVYKAAADFILRVEGLA